MNRDKCSMADWPNWKWLFLVPVRVPRVLAAHSYLRILLLILVPVAELAAQGSFVGLGGMACCMTSDAAGNVFIGEYTVDRRIITKYDRDLRVAFRFEFDARPSLRGLAVDAQGNVL